LTYPIGNPFGLVTRSKASHGQPMCTVSSLQWIFSFIPLKKLFLKKRKKPPHPKKIVIFFGSKGMGSFFSQFAIIFAFHTKIPKHFYDSKIEHNNLMGVRP